MSLNRNLPPVNVERFSMVPRGDVPRSTFGTSHVHKTTFQTGYLIPIHVDEVLPGDVHQGKVTIFARLANLLFPLMDNVWLETFFFFVPCRLVWDKWTRFMGERPNPGDSINFTVPQCTSAAGGFPVCSLQDYFGLPTVGQVGGANTVSANALPMRAYHLIWNEWFRDENLQNAENVFKSSDGPEVAGNYALKKRNKKHDYFTSCLPYPVKGGNEAALPLTGLAAVQGLATDTARTPTAGAPPASKVTANVQQSSTWGGYYAANAANTLYIQAAGVGLGADPLIYANLSTAVGLTLSAWRLAVASQQLLEKDSRGGTRYTELLLNHFGVRPEDARLQRPEYIGGGKTMIETQAIPQTSGTGITGSSSPLGSLSGQAVARGQHRFSYYATEHGYILGLVHVTADITYQQGLHRMWSRSTRLDFYFPAFAHLSEQAVRNDELYCRGDANDPLVFGYQERWAEYRHRPNRLSGMFRSTTALAIDTWHVAQKFTALPTLNTTFIEDSPPFSRVLAAGGAADNMQVLFDSVFDIRCTRAMPTYSVPGLDRF